MRRSSISATAFACATVGAASVVHACGFHFSDSVSTFPGMGFYRPDLLLVYPILSGAIERPLYTAAGYRVATLGYSIQANVIASVVVGTCGFFAYGFLWRSELMLALIVSAPVAAVLIKLWWFSRVPRDDDRSVRAGWFVLATLISTVVIAAIPLWMNLLGTDRSDWATKVMDLKRVAIVGTLTAAIAIHATLFARLKRNPLIDRGRGFEVLLARGQG